jgi:hypothetical protein
VIAEVDDPVQLKEGLATSQEAVFRNRRGGRT